MYSVIFSCTEEYVWVNDRHVVFSLLVTNNTHIPRIVPSQKE